MSASTAVHSNAFNFLSFVQSGVDARTGMYTVSLSLPEVKTCELSGPSVPLSLNFNPLNTLDSGFGLGWELAQTQYVPDTQIISLYSGETFAVTERYPGSTDRLRMKEQKIENFQLFELANEQYRVVHKSGLVETLELKGATPQVAVPVKTWSPQGHEVTLEYDIVNGRPMLNTIRDSGGTLVQVTRDRDKQTVTFSLGFVAGAPTAQVLLNLKNQRIDRVTLPTTEGAGWRFVYRRVQELDCISEVWTPLGAHETVLYRDDGHGFPGSGNETRKLPRVTDHITDPGAGNAPIVVTYSYGAGGHNFLGYGSGVEWTDDGLDNLFKVNEPYLYSTTESLMVGTDTVRSVTRTFNRFHLQTEETTVQGNRQKSVRTRYYADDDDRLTFDEQPRQCQLPRQTATLWTLTDDPRTWRQDKETSEYDIHGNQTLRVEPSGVCERITYYPAEGVEGQCPADPYGFVRHVREKTFIPASDPARVANIQAGALPLRTCYRYATLPPLSTSTIAKPWVCLVQERLFQLHGEPDAPTERQLMLTTFDYIDAPTDPLTHGRRARQAVTLGSDDGPTSFVDYRYSRNTANSSLRTEQTSSTDFDTSSMILVDERSMLNGEPLLVTQAGVQYSYRYDALNRVLSETQAPDTEYEATRRYSYRLIRPADAGQAAVAVQAYQQMEDVKDVKVRTHFDGMSRAVREELEDPDHSGGAFRPIYGAKYNEQGQLLEETEIDWLETTDLPLTTTYTYDAWGLRDSATLPDGVVLRMRNDPITFASEEWIDGTARTRTVTNRFDKTVSVERIGLDGQRIDRTTFDYDGLGNCVRKVDELGGITRYAYDAFARLTHTTLPDLSSVHNSYAVHSRDALRTRIEVAPGHFPGPARKVGEQGFDGLDRLTHLTVGPRTERLEYEPGQLQATRRISAAGKTIDFQYRHGLIAKPTVITSPDDEASFDVDLLDARLNGSKNSQGEYAFSYDQAGRLNAETWTDALDGRSYTTRYSTSLKGRALSRTDIGNHDTRMDYDPDNGRLLGIEQRQLQASFEYDGIGRLFRTTSSDKASGNSLTTTLEFDDAGRETLRTLVLRDAQGQPLAAERSIELTYRADSNVQTRHLRVAGATALLETYSYDLRGRLERYRCSGSDLPTDRFGNAIVSQYFEFDTLDNIVYTRTVFSDGRLDIAHFSFAADDPCQLVGVSHSHPDYQNLETVFSYDPDGNLERDETGHQLSYDSQGRLVSVTSPTGQPLCTYRYDAHDQLQAITPQGDSQTLRFYQGTRITDTLQDDHHLQFLHHRGQPLGQQSPDDDGQTLLLLTDAKHSVIAENQGEQVRSAVYGAYGERNPDADLQSLLAFNGEALENTGWYLLGNGYRAYNPGLMRFHSPDALSPFGAGGLNAYMYCAGNPIAFSDPTGHRRQGQIINNLGFNIAVAAVTTFLGIVLSFVTLNPGPLIAAMAKVGVTTTAATISTAVTSVTWGTSAVALGVETAGTFVKDANAREVLGWVALGLSAIMLPGVKGARPIAPEVPTPFTIPRARYNPAMRRSHDSFDELADLELGMFERRPAVTPDRSSDTPKSLTQARRVSFAPQVEEISSSNSAGSISSSSSRSSDSTFRTRSRASSIDSNSSYELPPALQKLVKRDQENLEKNVVLEGQQWFKHRKPGDPAVMQGIHKA